jgi:hypothetical protein
MNVGGAMVRGASRIQMNACDTMQAHCARIGRRWRDALSLLTLLTLSLPGIVIGASTAMAADISGCGISISKPGFYLVTQDLTAGGGDCITVNAARTTIFLGGHQITGGGNGAGVKFSARAANSFLEGGNATISGFAVGVEDDASEIRGDNFNANGNVSGGVLVNGVESSTFSNFQASNNGTYGVHFKGGASSVAESSQASGNGNFGIWLDGTKGLRIDNFDTEQNAVAGVYIGCASSGPGGACSGKTRVSSANQVYDGFADGNGPYGIAIDASATANLVTSVEAMNNKSADMLDLGKCGSSSWFGNTFTTATPGGCIN